MQAFGLYLLSTAEKEVNGVYAEEYFPCFARALYLSLLGVK
jgi:hypothetical protein